MSLPAKIAGMPKRERYLGGWAVLMTLVVAYLFLTRYRVWDTSGGALLRANTLTGQVEKYDSTDGWVTFK